MEINVKSGTLLHSWLVCFRYIWPIIGAEDDDDGLECETIKFCPFL